MTVQKKIDDFWLWFSKNAPHFGEAFQNQDLLAELDKHVLDLGDFAWEVGPGQIAANAFVLSPGGDRSLLDDAAKIVAAAPAVRGWEFHSFKPRKEWKPCFEIQDANGSNVQVDAREWRCSLLRHADGFREVVVEATNLGSLPSSFRQFAAEIALDTLLGERRRLEAVDKVTVVWKFATRERDAAFPIVEIGDRIAPEYP